MATDETDEVESTATAAADASEVDSESVDDLEQAKELIAELEQQLEEVEEVAADEPILKRTATQIAFARALADEMTDDGEPVDVEVIYDAMGETDDEDTLVISNNNIESPRREGWRSEIFYRLVKHVAPRNTNFMSTFEENLPEYQELSIACGRDGYGETLANRGHDPDEVFDEFGGS